MAKIARMSRPVRRKLIRLGRATGDPETAMRFLIISKLGGGKKTPLVAEELDVARSTVVKAANRFAEKGLAGLYDGRQNNGISKVDEGFRRRVVQILGSTPEDFGWCRPTWTRELLCLQMEREGWPKVAVCTMGRVLAHIGARLGSPKPIVICPWPRDAREAALAAIRRLEKRASASEPVLYADEVDIHLNPRIGRDWMLRGQQRRLITPGKNRKFYLAGALDVRSGRLHTTGAEAKDAKLFSQLLWLLASRYRHARRVHLIVDNYGVHKAELTQRALEALGGRVVLHFLPPYCPDANRIERVWQDLHANVTRNHRCRSMARLLEKVRRFVQQYRWRRAAALHHLLPRAAA